MLKLFIALQMAALIALAALEDRVTRHRDERGSVTIEQVLWAGAVIVIVGIVVAAIKFFVTSESAKIK
jgi:heme/copper-type cytochrome/quinol oxidase subunit 2